MERQLSAAQRDKLLMQESKEEKEFRKHLSSSLKESNNIFAESMKAISRPLQIVLVNFKKVAPKTAPKLLKSCQKIGKVAVKFEKLLLVARIFHGCS